MTQVAFVLAIGCGCVEEATLYINGVRISHASKGTQRSLSWHCRTCVHNVRMPFFGVVVRECLPSARPARSFSINYPDFSPRFTLSWRSPPSGPRCTAHTFPTKHVA